MPSNKFHGKNNKTILDNFVTDSLKKLRANKNKNTVAKYRMIGAVLHSIQDYYAHSIEEMSLSEYKKNADMYGNKEKYQKINTFHSDWSAYDGIEGRNKKLHKTYKDNPYAAFVQDKNDGSWIWKIVWRRRENDRYTKAENDSIKYLKKALKEIS